MDHASFSHSSKSVDNPLKQNIHVSLASRKNVQRFLNTGTNECWSARIYI